MFYYVLLFLHFVGIALGVGTGFANLAIGRSLSGFSPEDRGRYSPVIYALAKNGSSGLGLLIVTGVAMVLMRGIKETFQWGGPAFHAKLTLIVILIGVFGYLQVLMKKAREEGGGPTAAKIPKVGRIVLALSLAVMAAAVAAFR
jgi:hypothetical protein